MSNTRMLHQIVAVWRGRKRRAEQILKEAKLTFTKRTEHFRGHVKRYEPFDDGVNDLPDDIKALDTTVHDKLQYVFGTVVEYVDVLMELESTNQVAKATVYFKGQPVVEDVPVTMLMNLETILTQWREMLTTIPTLAPGIEWEIDEDHAKKNVYRVVNDTIKMRHKQRIVPQILWEPKAPEYKQDVKLEKINEQVPIGRTVQTDWCSMLTPAQKSEMLDNVDKLLEGVQDAFQRAKTTEVISAHIGQKLVDCVMNDV